MQIPTVQATYGINVKILETRFSWLLYKIGSDILVKIPLINVQLPFEYFVRRPGQATKDFLIFFLVKIHLINEHLFYKHFVCLSYRLFILQLGTF